MTRRPLLVPLLALLVTGCGGGPEPVPTGGPATPRVDRGRKAQPRGPDFDARWLPHVPEGGFLYMAFRGQALLDSLESVLPEAARPTSQASARGLNHWLRRLRRAAGGKALFPGGAAVLLDASSEGPAEQVPLDFWLLCEKGDALETALKAEGAGPDGLISGGPDHPPLLLGEAGGFRVLGSRKAWVEGKGAGTPAWVTAARENVRRRAGGYAVLDPARYLGGPFGERTRLRSPVEHQLLTRWHGLFPHLVAEVSELSGSLVLDFWAPLVAEHPQRAVLTGLFPAGVQLESPTRVPSSAPLYLAAALDWKAFKDFRATAAPERPMPDQQAPSPFQTSHGEQRPPDPGAAMRAAASNVAEAVEGWLLDWGGPEVAFVGTWDTREPRGGLLVANREPKRAVAAIRRFRASGAGKKLRFADGEAAGTPYRFTRLDGVDPRWLEPAYAFVGTSLCLATRPDLLERLLDMKAPKLEETAAFGGVFARLGKDLRLAAYLSPSILPRLLELLQRAGKPQAGAPPTPPPALASLRSFAGRVQGLALGAGLEGGERLRGTVVLTRSEPDGVDSGGAGAPR